MTEQTTPEAGEVRAVWAMTAGEVADVLDALEAADVAACSWCEEATDGELARTGAGEHDDECPMAGTGRFCQRAGELRRLAGLPVDYENARDALDSISRPGPDADGPRWERTIYVEWAAGDMDEALELEGDTLAAIVRLPGVTNVDAGEWVKEGETEPTDDLDPEEVAARIPPTFPVQPVQIGTPGSATCGTCGLSWDDDPDEPTAWTPAPSGRCPFEPWHEAGA
jgi:hypothetical protein